MPLLPDHLVRRHPNRHVFLLGVLPVFRAHRPVVCQVESLLLSHQTSRQVILLESRVAIPHLFLLFNQQGFPVDTLLAFLVVNPLIYLADVHQESPRLPLQDHHQKTPQPSHLRIRLAFPLAFRPLARLQDQRVLQLVSLVSNLVEHRHHFQLHLFQLKVRRLFLPIFPVETPPPFRHMCLLPYQVSNLHLAHRITRHFARPVNRPQTHHSSLLAYQPTSQLFIRLITLPEYRLDILAVTLVLNLVACQVVFLLLVRIHCRVECQLLVLL